MYPASDWSGCAPSHHGYQRACDLISGQASTGPSGSPVFACAGKTDPPCRLILSQTSAGNSLWGYVIDRSLSCAVPLFVPVRPFLRPDLRLCRGAARKGPSRLAVALDLPLAPAFPGHALTARARRHTQAGRGVVAFLPMHSNLRSLLRTAQAMRASLLASAIASTL
jgi:hypothetical protein